MNINLLSCLTKPVNHKYIEEKTRDLTILKNEKTFFFVLIETKDESIRKCSLVLRGLKKSQYQIYSVKNVEADFVNGDNYIFDDYYLSKEKASFPEILFPLNNAGIYVPIFSKKLYLICVNEKSNIDSDVFNLKVQVKDENREKLVSSKPFKLTVKNCELEKSDLIITNWFHYDCLSIYYKTKIFSKKYYKFLKYWISNYVQHGNNCLLVPVFTPALDTKVGSERFTTQLVDVNFKNNKYDFNFDKLDFFLKFISKLGIKYFEISHLFTQWGAKAAPKILVNVNGKLVRKFGWDTPSNCPEYRNFLSCFLPELTKYLKENGYEKNTFFHLSDEPNEKSFDLYKEHRAFVLPYLQGFKTLDALSHFEYKDYVDIPVVALDCADEFLKNKVDHMVYYCCGQTSKFVSNRFMNMPSLRTVVLGTQMFANNSKGFLQWGHNYYYTFLSESFINPYVEFDAGNRFSPGDAFVTYPGDDFKPINSLRHELMQISFQDYRLLKTLSNKIGYNKVVELIKKYHFDSYYEYSHEENNYFDFKDEVYSLLK